MCGRVDAEIEVKGTRPSVVSFHPGPRHCTRDRPTRPLSAPATPGLGIFSSPPGSLISVLLESGVPFSLCFKIWIYYYSSMVRPTGQEMMPWKKGFVLAME